MSSDIYQELAEHLKVLPLGFPAAPSGVEMKILRKLFTPEEAEIASRMTLEHESPGQLAERAGRQAEELGEVLERMLSKGLVDGKGPRGNRVYRAETYLNIHADLPPSRIGKEYVELFEQYLEEIFAEEMGKTGPPQIRAFPAKQVIPGDHEVLPFEQVSKMVADAKHYVISDCPCCKKMKAIGRDCKRRAHRCVSLYRDDFGPEIRIEYREGKRATRDEVISLLRTVEEEGFVHTGSNIQNGHSHICNCCPDCCPFLRSARLNKSPHIIAPSNYVATIDAESCNACGVCAEQRCPVHAIDLGDDGYKVNPKRCLGCGACVLGCPSGALSLEHKEESQISVPPADTLQWILHRRLREQK
ncbi:MAG: 4Fe-4S binding protein [Candidatus Lindowbacteria bacterium]|nr:4Fe-4S binding protein [Candidatus Lindowbacteria bacterium]